MSTVPHDSTSVTDEPLTNLVLFDYPGADIILRSQDGYHFRVSKTSIVNNSPILSELIRKSLDSLSDANAEASLPVVQLPESSEILHCLLTFIFLVAPLVPSTPEEMMELLSVAQKYQMGDALTHIRGSIARRNPTSRLEPALYIYALAQKYGLRPEALQAARIILNYPMTIEDFDNKLGIVPGASLYKLWKYHERVRAFLASDLTAFKSSCARGTITGLRCVEFSSAQIPKWLDHYIDSIGKTPNLFDPAELNIAMARHVKEKASSSGCECALIPSQTLRNFWEALASVVDSSFKKAESALSLVTLAPRVVRRRNHRSNIGLATATPLESLDVPDANLIIRSSDFVDFRVHKSVLVMASPFFKDLLSLPQPSDSETVDGLPLVQLSESSELLNSLVSILYPTRKVIPNSYEKALNLLAVCQKYDMDSVQSSIRAEVSCGGFPAPKGAEAFATYAIASAKDLTPEMCNAACRTLDHPMTFEILGDGLQFFEGWALRDLANYRKRCGDNLITCLELFRDVQPSGPSNVWVGCPEAMPNVQYYGYQRDRALPRWFSEVLSRNQNDLKLQKFTHPLDIHSRIRQECFTALQNHVNCNFCTGAHIKGGPAFYAELENKLAHALDKESVGPLNFADSPITIGLATQ